jgi:hypothetical protein
MSERKPLSRRHFLKGTLLGLGVAGAPMLLAACGGTPEPAANNATSAPVGTNATTAPATDAATSAPEAATSAVEPTAVQAAESVDVTLRLTKTDNMVGPIPTQDEQDADALMFGHAIAMQEWLDRNPGVKVEAIDRIEDPQAFRTALVAGTGPSVFGFANAGRRNAIAQNIVAEVTDLVKQYEIEQNLMDFALPLYQAEQFSGKYYSVPGSITAGQGIFYRRDIIQEKGLEEPKLGWTWDDLRTLAKALTDDKMKGIALDSWAIGAAINANMSESLLSKVPAPSTGWNWKYDFTTNAADWEKSITRYRAMIDEDQSVITAQDKGWGSFQAVDQGAAAMGNGGQFVFSWGFANIAKELGKPADEVIGYAPWPNGDRGNTNEMSRPEVLTSAFSVDLDSAGLAKIFDLFNYMVYGEGFTRKRVEAYNKSKDPAFAYDSRVPLAKNWAGQIGDIKGSVAEAVGPKFIETLNQMMTIPAVPQEALFLPGEETAGPSRDAWNQATTGWTFGADKAVGKYDVAADLKTLEETMNQQANGFTSSIDDAEFTEAAKKYYAAHDAFWKENAPKFHEEVYSPWYNEKVLPELGG